MPIVHTGGGGSLQSGLVAWFDMNPIYVSGSTIVARFSDTGTYTGTLSGTPSTGSTGVDSTMYYMGFNGSNQYAYGNQDLDFARKGVSNHFSISQWLKFDADTSGAIVNDYSAGTDATSIYRWEVQNGTNVIEYGINNGTTWSEATYYTTLGQTWHHVVLTYDGANQRIYVDNSLVTTYASTYTVPYSSSQRFTWGARFQSIAGTAACRIAHMRYYNRAITSTEIAALYNARL